MHRKSYLFLSVFLLMNLLLAPVSSAAALAPNLIQDPSLQNSYHITTFWQQASSNADWTVCTTSNIDCALAGVAAPRTGTRWGMFGIPDWEDPETINPEVATLSQSVTFPTCGASLEFYLWIGRADAGSNASDAFNVKIDGTTILTKSALDAASYSTYTLVTLDVSAYANGAAHTIEFHSITTDQAVIFNLDDISLTRTCVTISGHAGSAGTTVDYAGTTSGQTTANGSGNYSFSVPYEWSGTVTPSKTGFTFSPVNRSYNSLTTDQTSQNYTATAITYTISGSVQKPAVTLSYTDGSAKTATSDAGGNYSFTVSYNWTGTVTPTHPCFTFTPTSKNYANVLSNQTGQDYTAAAVPAAGCTDINVSIAGANQGTFSAEQGSLTQAPFAGVNNGPVKLDTTVNMIGSERVIYKIGGVNTSFAEMMGLPDSQLDNVYWLPWYNNVNLDTQLRFANVSANPATVTVTIGGVAQTPINLAAGESTRISYTGVDAGPVKIESTQNIVAAERVIYKINNVNTSFSEMMALPESQLDNVYWLPWYNNVNLDTQLRFANVSANPATVTVTIGGVAQTPINLAAGESTRISYTGVDAGPVKIESTQNIVAAERVIYKINNVNTSFSEMMGLPNALLDTTYWFPWYNNVNLDTQLRFGVP